MTGEWQPIDTAPTERPLLVAWRHGAIWQMTTAIHTSAPRLAGWWAWGSHRVNPTHWMPLPEPPQ